MRDPRIDTLAHNLINYSCRLQKGERVLIDTSCAGDEIVEALVEQAYAAGGLPYLDSGNPITSRALLMQITRDQVEDMTAWDSARMRAMQAYIAVRGFHNSVEEVDVPQENKDLWQSIYSRQVHHDLRVKHTKWVVLRWPTPSFAQMAGMSTRAFEDFYFDVCNLDYKKMDKAMDPLRELMQKTDKVRIVGPGTELNFSISGMPAVKCAGDMNIPDGEIYTAPVRDSVNGVITFNTPSIKQGFKFENVSLTFENGKVTEATGNDSARLNDILNTDEGARYVGEFALGVNPYITKPMCDILFDEKITGSLHFTPGSCYENADNGNQSAIHWDMVLIQTKEAGGGEIYFDGKLVRKDGLFVPDDLQALNPENLK